MLTVPVEVEVELRVEIRSEADVVTARQKGRELAQQAGFAGTDLALIATAISEVARNIIEYARQGEIVLSVIHQGSTRGVSVEARDQGPRACKLPARRCQARLPLAACKQLRADG